MSERGDEPTTPASSAGVRAKGSKENLSGDQGSAADLTGGDGAAGGGSLSKHGSVRSLAKPPTAPPPAPADAPTNALVYENTYKMKPDKKFQSEPVRRLAEEILGSSLAKAKYNAETSPELAKKIANEILAAVNKLEYERYKVVVDVTIGEFKGQGIRVASRTLWDTSTDTYASASFRNASLFAVAIVFGCYFE
ncbi:Tctex-1 family-domain-containing protein [Zopfochytrium polystomum]|nr:Tctex-1 family-domain-containing protein [Zopfochytrium polystomum]